VHPEAYFNRGKLITRSGLQNVHTSSSSIVQQETPILEESELGKLNTMIKHCLRCMKCKPPCGTRVHWASKLIRQPVSLGDRCGAEAGAFAVAR
jgi:hypothetical protein